MIQGASKRKKNQENKVKKIQVENASIHFFSAFALASFRMKAFSGGFITVW
jgi:hypothetical protein